MMRAFLILASTILLCSCNSNSAPFLPELQAEMIVSTKQGGFNLACVSKDALVEILKQIAGGEKTKAMAMIAEADCTQIPNSERFKILSVNPDVENLIREVEFVNVKSDSAVGMWTTEDAFQVQAQPAATPL
jgi:hypothetical protein